MFVCTAQECDLWLGLIGGGSVEGNGRIQMVIERVSYLKKDRGVQLILVRI